jgi:hypothetical protein
MARAAGMDKSQRNDRLAMPRRSHSERVLKDVRDLTRPIQEELEKFFIATDEFEDKKLKIIGLEGGQVGAACHQGRREIFRERRRISANWRLVRQPLRAASSSMRDVPLL